MEIEEFQDDEEKKIGMTVWYDEEYMVKVLSSVMKSELLSGRNKLESSRDLLNGGD